MPKTDIIVVDDDYMVGELSRDLLTEAGFSVLVVQDSLQAIPAIKAAMPRLVIMDIMMPGLSGLDICKTLKADPALRHIKIIICSAKAYEVEKQRALRLGADFFLAKPYDVRTYPQTVKNILQNSGEAGGGPPPPPPSPPPPKPR